jgi:hypothetical protein
MEQVEFSVFFVFLFFMSELLSLTTETKYKQTA